MKVGKLAIAAVAASALVLAGCSSSDSDSAAESTDDAAASEDSGAPVIPVAPVPRSAWSPTVTVADSGRSPRLALTRLARIFPPVHVPDD